MAIDPREAIRSELLGQKYGTNEPDPVHRALMHANGPKEYQHYAYTLQDKVTHAAKEITLWLPQRSIDDLKRRRGQVDTNLGHSINAASYGDKIWQAIERIAAALNVNISDIK